MLAPALISLVFAWQVPDIPKLATALDKVKAESAKRERCTPEPMTRESRSRQIAEWLRRSQESAAKFPHKKEFRDRAAVYSIYGPPDNIETAARVERWTYDCLKGRQAIVEFTDSDGSGEYRMSPLSWEQLQDFERIKWGIEEPAPAARIFYSHGSGAEAAVEITSQGKIEISLPLEFESKSHTIAAVIVSADSAREIGKVDTVAQCADAASECRGVFRMTWPSPVVPDAYILSAVVADAHDDARSRTYVVNFSVDDASFTASRPDPRSSKPRD